MVKNIQKTIDTVGKWINANQTIFLVFFVIAVVAEVYAFPSSVDGRYFGGLFFYWWLTRIGRLASSRTFQLVLVLLLVMFLSFLANGASGQTERLAVWFVLYFGFGIVQQWREMTS
jgi:hypothetical protein